MIKITIKQFQSLDSKKCYLGDKSYSSHLGGKETETTENLREITCVSHLTVKLKEFSLSGPTLEDKVWFNLSSIAHKANKEACVPAEAPILHPSISITAAQHCDGNKQEHIILQLLHCQSDTLAEGFTDLFAYEMKVCMFRNANASSAQEPHTTEKAAPWKLCWTQEHCWGIWDY